VIAPVVLIGFIYPLRGGRSADRGGQLDLPLTERFTWRGRELPFGVFLAPSAFVALVYGDRILDWYLGIAGLK